MSPTQRTDVRKKLGRHIKPFVPSLCGCVAEMDGIPVDDDRRKQVSPGNPVMLPLGCAIADFTLTTDAMRILERMVGLALVETALGAPLHIRVEIPFDNKQRAFDAADLAQRDRQVILARVWGMRVKAVSPTSAPGDSQRRPGVLIRRP